MDVSSISNVAPALDTSQMTAQEQAAVNSVLEKANTPAGGYLGKDEFLNLLVTQLSYQDPLNPMDSTESIAQLAQFSALEQMQNVGDQIESLRQASGLTDAMLLQGQTVEAVDANGAFYSGTVDSAVWSQNGLVLTIGGVQVPMSSITELRLVQAALEEGASTEGDSSSSDTDPQAPAENPVVAT